MYPELFHIGPIPIHGFGLMLAIAFLSANYLFTRFTREQKIHDDIPSTITLIALVAGIVGSKLFSIVEEFYNRPDVFFSDPFSYIFSSSGLTFYGGLLLSVFSIYIYIKRKKLPFWILGDAVAPSLILAYGIGRIGCQLAGDGDYGIPSTLPWAMGYPKGTVPTLSSTNIELANKFKEMFPGTPLPLDIQVHPTPVYETLACFFIFAILLYLRKKLKVQGTGLLFGVYLVGAGLERFLVEFIRLNPLYLGLSQAQWISIGLMMVGLLVYA
ncbi:MAG: prolipoprotein diacylglyceryl transferase, partial [Candidatus Kapabacteria bacterium]|nr:prolipoprotein diacylglyceryl transferase [Candidatus Kapabacteria bacterium]